MTKSSIPTDSLESDTSPTHGAADRDRFLDLLRLVSVLRVVALHTATKPPVIHWPWIQWIFPGMPAVFFVSGAVTAASLTRRPGMSVVGKRLRRLFPPYVIYAVAALAVMVITDLRSSAPKATLDRGDWLSFLFPVVRPTGSESRVVLWGHLWFLTAFFWVIALSPLTFRIFRRFRALSLLIPVIGFAVCVWADKMAIFKVREEYYQVTMFGWFFQLGYFYQDGTLQKIRPRLHLGIGLSLFAAGWTVAQVIEPVWKKKPNQLYSSQTGHFLIGAAWIFLAFAARGPVQRFLKRHRVRAMNLITQRTYTIFIWGPAANGVAMAVSRKISGPQGNLPVYLAVTVAVIMGLVLAFGWIEDWASSRRPRLLPT